MSTDRFQEMVDELVESNLSRIYRHLMDHECAIITAFRANPFDGSKCLGPPCCEYVDGKTKLSINKLNNRDLKAYLLSLGYGVTAVDGVFIENYQTIHAVEVSEDSLFVVNLNDDLNFFDVIIKMGKRYCQDSVMLIPKGGKDIYLYGTNNSDFPGLDRKVLVGRWKGGKTGEFMTKIRNRPFVVETYGDLSRLERMAVRAIVKNMKD